MSGENHYASVERLPTGIPGMDTVLRGGLAKGGIYIVGGEPGAGKTIFGNQLCFHHVARGGKAVFVTLLAESHARMMMNLSCLSFFDAGAIPGKLAYLSAFSALETEGLRGVLDLVRREVRRHGATVLVIDGLVAAEEAADSDQQFKKFIHDLQTQNALSGCTSLLLTSGGFRNVRPERTMVDGLILLEDQLHGQRRSRSIEVTKFRGSGHLRGQHAFEISDAGITVYPRLECLLARPRRPERVPTARVPFGVPGLDRTLQGGLPAGSTTMLLGPAGSGKTSFGLHFMSQCTRREPGVYFSFYETAERASEKAEHLGLDLRRLIREGSVQFLWYPTTENLLDQLGNDLVATATRIGARRVFIDSLVGFSYAVTDPQRVVPFFTAIANEFRAQGITTLYTHETRALVASEVEAPPPGISAILDNWIAVRVAEINSTLRRVISVLKIRDSDFDRAIREMTIGSKGIVVQEPFNGLEGLLTGFARRAPERRAGGNGRKAAKGARRRKG